MQLNIRRTNTEKRADIHSTDAKLTSRGNTCGEEKDYSGYGSQGELGPEREPSDVAKGSPELKFFSLLFCEVGTGWSCMEVACGGGGGCVCWQEVTSFCAGVIEK